MVTALVLAILKHPKRGDLTVYTAVMGLLLGVGPLGLLLHVCMTSVRVAELQ